MIGVLLEPESSLGDEVDEWLGKYDDGGAQDVIEGNWTDSRGPSQGDGVEPLDKLGPDCCCEDPCLPFIMDRCSRVVSSDGSIGCRCAGSIGT